MKRRLEKIPFSTGINVETELCEFGKDGWKLVSIEPLISHRDDQKRANRSKLLLAILEQVDGKVFRYRAVTNLTMANCSDEVNAMSDSLEPEGFMLHSVFPRYNLGASRQFPTRPCRDIAAVWMSESDAK